MHDLHAGSARDQHPDDRAAWAAPRALAHSHQASRLRSASEMCGSAEEDFSRPSLPARVHDVKAARALPAAMISGTAQPELSWGWRRQRQTMKAGAVFLKTFETA
jgi:hypothetical protein